MGLRRLAALFVLCAASPLALAASELTVRFTASFNGSLEGCDCKLTPRAGLVKAAAWIRSAHRPGVDLLLDAGDLFAEGRDELLEGALLASLADLGYAAAAVGEREVEAGAAALLTHRGSFPLLANNLSLRDSRGSWVPFGADALLLRTEQASVAVLSLLDPQALDALPAAAARSVRLEPPREAASRLLADPRVKAADFVVLLYHGGYERAAELLRGTPGVHLAIVAHEQKLIPAHRVAGSVVVSPGEAGNRVGTVTLTSRPLLGLGFAGQFQSFSARFGPDDPAVRRRIGEYEAALRDRLGGSRP
jgi:2',3'-cyclic-nucleotide 2'-phosphodiesterase (5'-nucleotidase family)